MAKFLTDPVWWFFLIWLPDFFKKTRHLDIKNSWLHLVTIYGVVTVLSIWGGKIPATSRARHISIGRARKIVMFGCACCVVPIVFVTKASDWGAVFLIGFAGAAHQAWSANLFTSASDMFPQKALGSMVGLGGMAGSIGGMLFQIYIGQAARSLREGRQRHRRLRHPVRDLRLGLSDRLRGQPRAGARFDPIEVKV